MVDLEEEESKLIQEYYQEYKTPRHSKNPSLAGSPAKTMPKTKFRSPDASRQRSLGDSLDTIMRETNYGQGIQKVVPE